MVARGGCLAWFVLACPQGLETRVRKCPKSERAALQKCLDEERAGGAEQGTVKPGGLDAVLGVWPRS